MNIQLILFNLLKAEKNDRSSASYKIQLEEKTIELNDLKGEMSIVKETNDKLNKKLRQTENILTEKVSKKKIKIPNKLKSLFSIDQ